MKHLLEIEVNAEGQKLAILSPVGEDGELEAGYRIAGPKAWGGSRSIARLNISNNDLKTYIKSYAENLHNEIKADAIREVVRIYLDASDSALDKADKLEKDND